MMDQRVKFAALGLHIRRPSSDTPYTGEYVPWHNGRLYRVDGGLIILVILIRFIGDIVVIIVVVIIIIVSSPCWYGDHVSSGPYGGGGFGRFGRTALLKKGPQFTL